MRALVCTSGTYFLKGPDSVYTAVFKPSDEEQFMPYNPFGYIGYRGQLIRKGIPSGDNYKREIAAYIIDNLYGDEIKAGIPLTWMVEVNATSLSNGKINEIQKEKKKPDFMKRSISCENISLLHTYQYKQSKGFKIGSIQEFVH